MGSAVSVWRPSLCIPGAVGRVGKCGMRDGSIGVSWAGLTSLLSSCPYSQCHLSPHLSLLPAPWMSPLPRMGLQRSPQEE